MLLLDKGLTFSMKSSKCPHCDRPGKKIFKGYCSKAHWKLKKKKAQRVVLACANCGDRVIRNPSQVPDSGVVYCKNCPKHTGENHPRWKEGQYLNDAGYRLILVGNEYKLEHRHTWEVANRASINPWMHGMVAVHHINMNKTDNRPENLVLLTSEDHGRIHRLIDAERYEEAKCILMNYCEQQDFFLQHSEHLEYIRGTSLQDILGITSKSM